MILVDHNEVAQAVDDIRHGTVLEVWEHHRIGDLQIPSPITFHCEPVGATATLIAEQFFLHDIEPPPAIGGALLAAILSDTLVLASPTTSSKDRRMAPRLAALAGVEVAEFGAELMAARGEIATHSARDLIEADFKAFNFAGHRVGIAQVEVPDARPLAARHEELLEAMWQVKNEQNLRQVILIGTDITRKGSYLWAVGEVSDVVARAFKCVLSDEGTFLEGLMSRKKRWCRCLRRLLPLQRLCEITGVLFTVSHWREAHGQNGTLLDLAAAFLQEVKFLRLILLADGDDHATAFAQLLNENGREGIGRAGDDDGIKGPCFGPAKPAIAGGTF